MKLTSVAVLGSCITRDNFNRRFNPGYKQWYEVGPTTNQSSMIALMSPRVDLEWEPIKPLRPYGRWNIHSDLSREILGELREAPPDVLALDFFGDVHFGVLRMADGRYVTNNRWRIHKTDLYARLIDDPATQVLSWETGEDQYVALWIDAMDRFAAFMAEHCPSTTVVVHAGFNALDSMPADSDVPKPLHSKPRAARLATRGNGVWERLQTHACEAYSWESIDLHDEWYPTFPDHPWGAFDVHYSLDYYPRFLAELHRLVLRRELPPATAERVDAVGDAAHTRILEELAHWRSVREAPPAPTSWWRRRRESSPPAWGVGPHHELLRDLLPELDGDAGERVSQLVTTADEHISTIRRIWPAWISAERSD